MVLLIENGTHALDDHLRIAQLHTRIIETDKADGTPGSFGQVRYRGRADSREWPGSDWITTSQQLLHLRSPRETLDQETYDTQ